MEITTEDMLSTNVNSVKSRLYRKLHPEKCHEYDRKKLKKHRHKIYKRMELWRMKNGDRVKGYYRKVAENIKARQFKKSYGITIEEKESIIIAQNNKCAICGNLFNNSRETHIDHCHATNKIRGVLCSRCNLGLGHFKDNKLILANAISYLEKYV